MALYYFGNNNNEIEKIINDTSSGQAVFNEWGFQYAYDDLPFWRRRRVDQDLIMEEKGLKILVIIGRY